MVFVSLQLKQKGDKYTDKNYWLMNKITILKHYRNTETLKLLGIEEAVTMIRQQAYDEQCRELRDYSLVAEVRQRYDSTDGMLERYTKDLPRVCFAAAMENRNHRQVMRSYNGLVLLEVNNLAGREEAEGVRQGAAMIPHTLLAFVGASGRSVKIVCRGELFEGGLPTSQGEPSGKSSAIDEEAVTQFHTNLYEKARVAYNMQLGVTIEKLEPRLDRSCYMSSDQDIFYNPQAIPFYTDATPSAKAIQPVSLYADSQESLLPGYDNYHALMLIYQFCLSKAYDDVEGITEDEDEARNSMTMRALSQGVKCWDKDIRRYVDSNDIELYEPMTDFLDHLPKWDGQDRVEALARRVKTDYDEWPRLFHIWMRSMVALWRGKGQLTGNALVPILIGRQGCGKTSFCRILLPHEQREYYNDRINFKNENDLNLGLTSFALINLDEFDKITQRQQVVLKYLVSTSDLKYRPPYGKAYSSHRRFASFIGTTNESTPLTDPSGSRRFICVTVEGDIDFRTPIDYGQLYAQLEYEVSEQRLRYHLTRDEEHALMEHNLRYQRLSQLGEQLLSLYEKPEGTSQTNPDGGRWMTLKDISARLKQVFRAAYQEDDGIYIRIGNFLSRPEYRFENDRKSAGMVYWVKERLADEQASVIVATTYSERVPMRNLPPQMPIPLLT